jgi:hypothetical protein
MKRLGIALLFSLFTITGYATTTQVKIDTTTINSQFFVAIIAGVLLALIFQVLLTALSVALGISMIGNLKQSYVDSKVKPKSNSDTDDYTFDQDYDSGTSTGVKISSAFGVWSLFTTALALFGACALALNLSFFGSVASNLTVALVIWALFFLILFYLETRIVNTVVGGLVTTATSGLKSSANAVKQLFTSSQEKKVQKSIDNTIDKIRKDFNVNLDTSKLSDVLDKFVNRVDNKLPNYDTLKKDLESIAKKSKSKNTAGKYMAIQQVLSKAIEKADSNGNSTDNNGKVEQLKTILAELKEAYTSDSSTTEGIKDIVTEYSSIEKSQIDEKINQVKQYLSDATPESLSKDTLSKDLNKILSDPKSIGAVMSKKFQDFDRNKIIDTLSQNSNLDKNQLNTYADNIENAIDKTRKTIEENDINTIKTNTEKSIANFFDGTEREELRYDDLKRDLNKIYNNPKDSLTIIKSRLSKMDGETVKALVTNNNYIDEKHIDGITSQISSTFDTIKSQVASIEQKAHEQLEMTKRKAVIQAEHARKTAASAAWWLVITVIVSGGAAMLGAWIELV